MNKIKLLENNINMDMYKKTLKELKKEVKKNNNLTSAEWDKIASERNCYTSITMEAHNNTTFKQMKEDILWYKFF